MPAKVVNVCNAIVSYLNGLTLSQSFTAIRVNRWYDQLETSNGLQVVVLPVEKTLEPIDRGSMQRTFQVAVVIQKNFVAALNDEDAMLLLCEEIEDALYSQDFANFGFQGFDDIGTAFMDDEAEKDSLTFKHVLLVTYLGE